MSFSCILIFIFESSCRNKRETVIFLQVVVAAAATDYIIRSSLLSIIYINVTPLKRSDFADKRIYDGIKIYPR